MHEIDKNPERLGGEVKRIILFKKEFIPLIRSGYKTQTRRIKTQIQPGDTLIAKTGYYSKPFARLKALKVFKQALCYISQKQVRAEGFEIEADLIACLEKITKGKPINLMTTEFNVIEFEVTKT